VPWISFVSHVRLRSTCPISKGQRRIIASIALTNRANLKSKDAVQQGLVDWFKSWQPDLDDQTARARAADYMKSYARLGH